MIAVALFLFCALVPNLMGQDSAGTAPPTATSNFHKLSESANQARNENRDTDAIALYKRALSLRPEWDEGLWYLSTLLYDQEQYSQGRDFLRRFVVLRADVGTGWALLGMSEFQTREYGRALDHLQRAMALGLGDRKGLRQSVFYFAAVLLTRFERYDESMDMLMKMIATDQDSGLLVEPAGLSALRMPLLPSEIPANRREAVRMAGEAIVALQTQHLEDAEAKFKQLEDTYPNEPGVHFLYGAYLMQLHREDGIREMNRELEISPTNALARVRLALEYLAQQQVALALPLAREAVRLDPKRASAHMALGEALIAHGDLSLGTTELEAARNNDQLNRRVLWDLMRAYTASGRTEDAEREKAEIKKLSGPDSGGAPMQEGILREPATK